MTDRTKPFAAGNCPEWCQGHDNNALSCIGKVEMLEAPGGWVYAIPLLGRAAHPDGTTQELSPQLVVSSDNRHPALSIRSPQDAVSLAGLLSVIAPDHGLARQVRSKSAQAWPEIPEPEA